MPIERREYSRFKKALHVIIHNPYAQRDLVTSDISMGGACISNVQKYYSQDQAISLEITLDDGSSIFCEARVVSSYPRTKDAEVYMINLQFMEMPDSDKERLKACIETPE